MDLDSGKSLATRYFKMDSWQSQVKLFKRLWLIIKCWRSFWDVSDGYLVYPYFIEPEDHLVSKT